MIFDTVTIHILILKVSFSIFTIKKIIFNAILRILHPICITNVTFKKDKILLLCLENKTPPAEVQNLPQETFRTAP